jgi:predicted GNAT family N-acyltransferase
MSSIESRLGAAAQLLSSAPPPCQGNTEMKRIRIREASWPADKPALETVRCEVFVKEQNVPRSLEFDRLDASALHWLALTPEDEPVGTLRLLPSGQIGRTAVLRTYRSQGIGSRLLRHAIAAAEAHGWGEVWLNAQYARRGFYARHGFIVISDIFEAAGIPHQRMLRRLNHKAVALRHAPCVTGSRGRPSAHGPSAMPASCVAQSTAACCE